jgi:hypothetical protein
MSKYCLDRQGYGKSFYFRIISISESKAKKLKSQGVKVFNSRLEAEEYIRSKK